MASSQELLEQVARDGSWDSQDWPQVLEEVLTRLDKIVRTEFPIPVQPPEPPPQAQLASPPAGPSSQDSTTSNKENAPAKTRSPPSRPPVPSFPAAETTREDGDLPTEYPSELVALHRSIRKSLKNGFPKYPLHTIQRLAELVLWPKKHYRFLPSYLRALDRVVSVQSTTELYPLPHALTPHSGGMLNGASSTPSSSRATPELGSDESLGGALLTPIPWLANRAESTRSTNSTSTVNNDKELQTSSTEMVEGPNGAGRIETVNVVNGVMTTVTSQPAAGLAGGPSTEEILRAEGAVTQGELLRQEQEAGVVATQPRSLRLSDEEMDEIAAEEAAELDKEESETASEGTDTGERPHARGPEEIGQEDIGPQDRPIGGGLDLEAAVGRTRRDVSVDPEDASLSDAGGGREEEMHDAEEETENETETPVAEKSSEDAVVADADGDTELARKAPADTDGAKDDAR